jgi:hypothetical protein
METSCDLPGDYLKEDCCGFSCSFLLSPPVLFPLVDRTQNAIPSFPELPRHIKQDHLFTLPFLIRTCLA